MKLKIDYNENDLLDGLFSHLFQIRSKSQIQKFVQVTASSTLSGRGDPFTTIDPIMDKSDYYTNWISESQENSSITISFVKHQFAINSYTLQRRINHSDNYPLQWILEATNDRNNWFLIHNKIKGEELSTSTPFHWVCPQKEFYREYKFTMIGENSWHYDYLKYMFAIGTIEFFGSLFETICTIHPMQILDIRHLFIWILLQAFE